MFHTSQIEISRSALKQNLDFVCEIIGPEVRFCSVVKGTPTATGSLFRAVGGVARGSSLRGLFGG